MGSSLTSQITAKSAINCDIRLRYRLDYFNITNKYNKASTVADVFISKLIDIIDLFVFNFSNILAHLIPGLLPINKKIDLNL